MPEQKRVSLWELSDLSTPWCIYVAATLHVAEHIAGGIDKIDDLARAAGCNSGALHQVLGRLVSKGVFEEIAPGRFALNEAARELLDPATRLGLDLDGIGGRMAYAWITLLSYVRTGAPAYHEVFGLPFWEDLEAHPQVAASFDALIGPLGHGTPNGDFQISGGWEAVQVLRAHPAIQGILVDQPKTVTRSA
jgi:hypothetical protein